jgi:two-component system, cell cycle sensor histidine kinase and response regulator CckA
MLKTQSAFEPPESSKTPIRLLIVEDNLQDAELLVATMIRAGYLVQHEVAPTEERLRQHLAQADFDVTLIDYNLQNWTGMDALDILKQSGKNIPAVMVTGSLGDEAAVECIKEGASDYVLKDRIARLPLAVRRTLMERDMLRERSLAQVALQESEEKYRDILENANDLIQSYAQDGRILYANRAWKDTLGYCEEEVTHLKVFDVIHADSRESFTQHINLLLRGEGDCKSEIKLVTKDGRTILGEASRSCKFIDGKPAFVRSIIRDITERRQLEDRIRQSAKMEAIGQLAGGVAHDFNNLLTVILGYAHILQQTVGPAETEPVAEIVKSSERAASLTRQLLAFSRLQVMVPQNLDLNFIVGDMERMLERLLGENYELAAIQQPDLGRVKADPGQIEQVILNLVVNARDAMPRGGKITIETADVYLDEAYARSHVTVVPGPYVMLAVSDTGTGMDTATISRIFEPFFTTKEPGRGTGLGLSTVYGIVKQSSGNVWVYSEIGKGSVFKVYLPRILEPAENVGRLTITPKSVGGNETVLLVEDEEAVRSLVRVALRSNGYKVLEAKDGEQALAILEDFRGPIDLLLTDVVMPNMNGQDLAERLGSLHPEAKVLYMSGYTDSAVIHHDVMGATASFVQKPFMPKALLERIRDVFDQKL